MNMSIRNNTSDLVTSEVTIDGTDVPGEYMVSEIQVEHEINRIPTASVTIADGSPVDADFEASAQSMFEPGGEIEIKLGYHTDNASVFKGLILKQSISVARDGSSHLRLECRDAAIKSTLTRSSIQFHEATDSDVIETLLKKSGLSADVEATSLQREHQIKTHSSDWDFIISRAEANGLITNIRDGKVKISAPSFDAPDLAAEYGDTLGIVELELDATHQLASVKSQAWDPKTQAVVTGDASEPSVNDQGDLDGKKLASVLDLPPLDLQSSAPLEVEELKTWADAQMLKSRMARVRGRVQFSGNPDIKPDQALDLAGLGKRFNGLGYVSRVRHILTEGEWTTEVGFGLPRDWYSDLRRDMSAPGAAGLRPGVSGLQIGTVLKIDEDPQGQRRIQIAMPLQADGEQGVWVRMSYPYATKEAGFAFMPEIGDEVVLGFLGG